MEIIRQWTSIFLDGLEENVSHTRRIHASEQIKNIAFGRTTCEHRTKISNRYVSFRHRDRERKWTSLLKTDTKRLSFEKKKPEPYDYQQGKIHGRQIMNRNHDPRKAEVVRQRQKQYSIQVQRSRRNTGSLNIDSITRVVVQGFKNLIDCERCALFLMDHRTHELYLNQ